MDSMFEATQKLWADELTYWTAQMTRMGEAMTGEAEKAGKLAQETWSELVKRQTGLMTEYGRHVTDFAQKQLEIMRGAAKVG